MTAIRFSWTAANGVQYRDQTVDLREGTNPQLPIVILLHGLGGNRYHMDSPAISPGQNYELFAPVPSLIDRGWRTYPNVGIWGFEVDPFKRANGWQPSL
jgi:hypothetical protein